MAWAVEEIRAGMEAILNNDVRIYEEEWGSRYPEIAMVKQYMRGWAVIVSGVFWRSWQ
jgi:hypothetical protein